MHPLAHKIYKEARQFVLAFVDKELTLFAASLSFYTIFTIIPLLLIVLTLLTSMPSFADHYEKIKGFIFSNLMPVQSELIMHNIDSFVANSAKVGAFGLLMIYLIVKIENIRINMLYLRWIKLKE